MTTVSQKQLSYQELIQEITQLRESLQFADSLIDELRAREQFHKDVLALPTEKVTAYDKVAILATDYELLDRKTGEDGLTRVWIPNIAERGGVNDDTVTKAHKKLTECKGIKKTVERDKNGNRRVSLAFTPAFLVRPAECIALLTSKARGGKREKRIVCPDCHEIHPLVKTKTVTCTGCGSTFLRVQNTIEQYEDDVQEQIDAAKDDRRRRLHEHLEQMPDITFEDALEIGRNLDEMSAAAHAVQEEQEGEQEETREPLPFPTKNTRKKKVSA